MRATKHLLKIPTQKDVMEHSRASIHVTDARRSREIRVSLEPSGALYDRLVVSAEGYSGPVPIIHKAAVVSELLTHLASEDEEDDPEF